MKFMGSSMTLKCPGPMTAEKPQSSLCWCALFGFCALWSDIFTLVPRCTVWPSDEVAAGGPLLGMLAVVFQLYIVVFTVNTLNI